MRRTLLIFAFAAVAVGTFAWRMGARSASRALEPVMVLPDRIAVANQALEPGDLREATLRDEVELPAGVQSAQQNPTLPIEDRVAKPAENPDFEAQYAGWSKARLEERINALEPVHLAEIERLCVQRFEAGIYRVVGAGELEGLDEGYDVLSDSDKQGVLTRSRIVVIEPPGNAPVADSESEPDFEYQIVSLPPEVFPELYTQRAELDWLRATLEARADAGEDPK